MLATKYRYSFFIIKMFIQTDMYEKNELSNCMVANF